MRNNMSNSQSHFNKDVIFIVPHYINSLKYYDKIYILLKEYDIEIIFIINNDNEMIKYCEKHERKYQILDFYVFNKYNYIFEPVLRYKLKRNVRKIFKIFEPKLILQPNDMRIYNDIIVKVAKEHNVITLALQWAITLPEKVYFENRQKKLNQLYLNKSIYKIIIIKFINKILKIIHYPLNHFFRVNSNHKLSLGQGDSDYIGVINNYTKNLLITQGVSKDKIRVLGSFHYDDALNIKREFKKPIKKSDDGGKSKVQILFISQPFYKKDITFLSLEKQLKYIKDLIVNLDNFFENLNKKYILLIKLHPVENIKDYEDLLKHKNIKLISIADNNELILSSDFCISQYSTVMQSVIILRKPLLSLNILGLKEIKIGSKVLGVKKCINTWEELHYFLNQLEEKDYNYFDNINYDRVLMDGNCYNRVVNFIFDLVKITKNRIRP